MSQSHKTLVAFDIDGTTNAAATEHVVFTAVHNNDYLVNVTLVNRHATVATDVNVALVPSGATQGDEHYIEYTKELTAQTSMKLSDIALSEGDTIVALSTNAAVSIVINGEYAPEAG